MREEDLGNLGPGDSLMAITYPLPEDETLTAIRKLVRSSKIEQRFVGGLDQRRLATFYLIEQSKLAEILGDEP